MSPCKIPEKAISLFSSVMGTTGVGKSTFINAAVGSPNATTIGHELRSCTSKVQHVVIPDPAKVENRIVFVDTLGFNHTYVDDSEIIKRITAWLKRSYGDHRKPNGILYLYDVSQSRDVKWRTTIPLIRNLCGEGTMSNVVVATTKWDTVREDVGLIHEQQVAKLWNYTGSRMARFSGTPKSAWDIVTLATKTCPVDTMILMLSQTGAGKSSFINTAAGSDLASVSDAMQSCTTDIQPIYVPHPRDPNRRIVFVDTPGFNDASMGDAEILRRIVEWLQRPVNEKIGLRGIIYLLEITESRIDPRNNLMSPSKLSRPGTAHNVVLATTKWDDIQEDEGQRRQQQRSERWQEMLDQGSYLVRFTNTRQSAWEVVDLLLQNHGADDPPIQRELPHALTELVQQELTHAMAQLPERTQTGFIARLLSVLFGTVTTLPWPYCA
ncbi:hypothetical protein BV22DRAFT_439623 [Leucogyrophana mollusca]|uniref:Uncharacterized protein n=1 Tax=Leucogyrophana mollusca TaxID=85980 RepID=A0ACB8BJ52_9AGAM|nr:hypothetical protein BV22DRAFT_439623 [Leucogyrophana mollusca]